MIAIHYAMAAILVCAVSVSARHHHPEPSAELAEDAPTAVEEHDAATDGRRRRRKRWYSSYGFQQPTYRDDSPPPSGSHSAPYDPFAYIYKRLDELAALIRQPLQSQSPSPIFVPYPLYYPQGCGCGGATAPAPAPGQTPSVRPTGNTTGTVTTEQRFGGDGEDDYDDVPLRPLTFDPVKPDRPLSRPVPSVEHGSTQAGVQQGREPQAVAAPPQAGPPAPAAAGAAQGSSAPSTCDFAILTCCHQRYTTNKCFEDLRCPNALRSGNPCNSRTLTNVVSLFQDFYRTQN